MGGELPCLVCSLQYQHMAIRIGKYLALAVRTRPHKSHVKAKRRVILLSQRLYLLLDLALDLPQPRSQCFRLLCRLLDLPPPCGHDVEPSIEVWAIDKVVHIRVELRHRR